ncbi:hypothetical protein D3C80_1949980 [compost metagenome]
MGADQDDDDAPERFLQMKGDHKVKLRTEDNSTDGNEQGAGLDDHIQPFTVEIHPRHRIGGHCSYQ